MCTVARMVEDGKTYWVAGGGTPLYATLLGKKLYAPDAQYITEDGVVAPEPRLPFRVSRARLGHHELRRFRCPAWLHGRRHPQYAPGRPARQHQLDRTGRI